VVKREDSGATVERSAEERETRANLICVAGEPSAATTEELGLSFFIERPPPGFCVSVHSRGS